MTSFQFILFPVSRSDVPPKTFSREILVPFCLESSLSGVSEELRPDQKIVYRKQFDLPDSWRSRRIRLIFEAVDYETTVLVNNIEVGRHCGGLRTNDQTENIANHISLQAMMLSISTSPRSWWLMMSRR